MTTFGVDQNEVVSDAVEGATAPTTSFTFDLVMTTDHELDEEVPEGFTRVIGDVNYFKVKFKNTKNLKNKKETKTATDVFFRLLPDISPLAELGEIVR